MDKTISISLGGFSFIIDEVAYNKLKKYLDQIRISLGNIEGVDEIMSDVEVRIAELFKERLSGREVVNSFDVEHVIEVMGEPEQYVDEDAEGTTSFKQSSETKKKKLYRDPKDKVLAGVLSGLAHYIGVETWITRVAWIVLFFADIPLTGTMFTIISYIILWIVLPKAETTSQRYEMLGKTADLENIKKSATQFSAEVKKATSNTSSTIGQILRSLAKVALIVFGCIFILMGIGFLITAILVFVISAVSIPFTIFQNSFDHEWQDWLAKALVFLIIVIPAIFSVVFGASLISSRVRVNKFFVFGSLGLWISSIVGVVILSLGVVKNFTNEINFADKNAYTIPQDTLVVEFKEHHFKGKKRLKLGFDLVVDDFFKIDGETLKEIPKKVEVFESEDDQVWVEVAYFSKGSDMDDARKNAEKIEYNYQLNSNGKLELDAFLALEDHSKIRNQSVGINLYVPKDKAVNFKNVKTVVSKEKGSNFKNYEDGNNKFYKFVDDNFVCLNCPEDDNHSKKSSDGAKVNISVDGINIQDGDEKVIINKNNIKITDGTDSLNINVLGN